eukprot:12379542-Alexandrium_andersonii.AAC.1
MATGIVFTGTQTGPGWGSAIPLLGRIKDSCRQACFDDFVASAGASQRPCGRSGGSACTEANHVGRTLEIEWCSFPLSGHVHAAPKRSDSGR